MLVYKMDRLIFFKIVFEKSYYINIDQDDFFVKIYFLE